MRFVAYDDQVFERRDGGVWTNRTFPLFIAEVGRDLDSMTVIGRSREPDGGSAFRLPDEISFVALPYYESLADPVAALKGMASAMRRFWRSLDDADGAWVLGPHPLGLAFAIATLLRRRRLVLGVRQEMRAYVRRRRPGRRSMYLAADLLELAWRALARVSAVIVVGPELARQYRAARRRHVVHVSMVRDAHLVAPEAITTRRYDGTISILSVGRLDEEKNPLLLAEVLARLHAGGGRWRMTICGVGPKEADLRRRLRELGVADAADLKGYVPVDDGLRDLYLSAHLFLHVSWTEGVPQVLFEAFAARLPVIATDVGGVASIAAGGAALLIPPGDLEAAVDAVRRLVADADLRESLGAAGAARAAAHTLESEAAAVARFLVGD